MSELLSPGIGKYKYDTTAKIALRLLPKAIFLNNSANKLQRANKNSELKYDDTDPES